MVTEREQAVEVAAATRRSEPVAPQAGRAAAVSRPWHLGARWIAALVLAWLAVLVLMLRHDVFLTDRFSELAGPDTWLRRILKLAARFTSWYVFVGLAAVLALQRGRVKLLTGFGVAVGGCIGVLHLLKAVIGRARPDQLLGPQYYRFLGDQAAGFDSFPSGHATLATLLAALVCIYFPRLRWPVIVLATCTALSRVALERHYPSDVVGGIGLALASVAICVRVLGLRCFHAVGWFGTPHAARRN